MTRQMTGNLWGLLAIPATEPHLTPPLITPKYSNQHVVVVIAVIQQPDGLFNGSFLCFGVFTAVRLNGNEPRFVNRGFHLRGRYVHDDRPFQNIRQHQ